jgi:hypothetical protein
VALVVGGIEALGLLGEHFHLEGWFWGTVAKLNDNFGTLGYSIVGLFALSRVVSLIFSKWRRFVAGMPARRSLLATRSSTKVGWSRVLKLCSIKRAP